MKDYGIEVADFIYYKPGKWDKEGQFWPIRGGISAARPGYSAGPKRIECFSIHFVREGILLLEYEGKLQVLQAGDMFCLFPERTYSYRKWDETKELQLCWLALDGPGAAKMLSRVGVKPEAPYAEKVWSSAVQSTVDDILACMRKEAKADASLPFHLQSLLYRFFSLLVKDETPDIGTESLGWIERSMAYMELHAAEGISVQHVAEVIGLNRTYFSSTFSKHTGMSPLEYITKVRMSKGKRMLQETSASVTEIAYSLGYPTLFAFTRAFRNSFSLSPSEFRKKNTQN